MPFSFSKTGTLADFQKFVGDVYGAPDDRLYSVWDLLVNEQRFAMRALKGIRKEDTVKLRINLLISFSWLMAICNRLHVDVDESVWRRFPYLCSYCGRKPCVCKKVKPSSRRKPKVNHGLRPKNIADMQKMFNEIYPSVGRSLADAGVHLAEETGEVSEAIHNYLGQHREGQFNDIKFEIADVVSCIFGVANSAGMSIAEGLAKMYVRNCHVCHKAPCACSFSDIVRVRT